MVCVCVQFFQRLETLAREYLLEVKVRLLEQLSLGFNSPQLAISFIEMLLDEYFTLADALPYLHQLLQPLVSICLSVIVSVYMHTCMCVCPCMCICVSLHCNQTSPVLVG